MPEHVENLRYNIIEWDEKTGGWRELHGQLARLGPAKAAFEAVCRERPNAEITLQERARVISKREPGCPDTA